MQEHEPPYMTPADITATYVVSLFDSDKEGRQQFANRIIESIEEGREDALKMYITLKKMQEVCSLIIDHKIMKDATMKELALHGQKEVEIHGAKATTKETGVKYDYTSCNDSQWNTLKKEKEALEKRLKERETFLKSIPAGGVANPDTGEVITKPAKISTTSPVITLL